MLSLYVATVGAGLYRSDDLGLHWARDPGLPDSSRLYSLSVASQDLLVGGEDAIHRAGPGDWSELRLPAAGKQVWAVAVLEGRILAGTRPLGLFRSDDGGASWAELPFKLPAGTPEPHTPRITVLLPNRDIALEVWAGVEVGGIFQSADGGLSWNPVNEGLPSLDIHSLAWSSGSVLLASTPRGVAAWRSARWVEASFEPSDRYCRGLAGRADAPGTIFCGFGDGPPGSRGGVAMSVDGGRSWRACVLPAGVDSTIWSLATAPEMPDLVLACSISGKVLVSRDGGAQWALAFSAPAEARAVACLSR